MAHPLDGPPVQVILPEHEWTSYEEDTPYLSPLIDEIEAELKEREDLESMVVQRKANKA
ncbi:hypothetical protein FH972_025867 [Carpinus fangiana]|uniref:Uncharacterized protein n=1 Tax=Carpinus fangiana TaxID=176857 RepID=A0A5N6L2M9_9ROSI|nr:hypothetical protein FH972_025867 [Carpinus fangiana]